LLGASLGQTVEPIVCKQTTTLQDTSQPVKSKQTQPQSFDLASLGWPAVIKIAKQGVSSWESSEQYNDLKIKQWLTRKIS
jgi:hypothetical protein